MFSAQHLVCIVFLSEIIAVPQINFYRTDQVSEDIELASQYNCLRLSIHTTDMYVFRQIISFCLNELSLQSIVREDNSSSSFTFGDLSREGITSKQLYQWSAPIDVTERYQFYLNQLPTSSATPMASEVFFNCTFPRFGLTCQYEFDFADPSHSTLEETIENFYRFYRYDPIDLTCYVHIPCNRGRFPACLDWSEVCDGVAHCLDGADEQHCSSSDLDESQRYRPVQYEFIACSFGFTSFLCDDVICSESALTGSCLRTRFKILFEALFASEHPDVSAECWSAFKCVLFTKTELVSMCNDSCAGEQCVNIIDKTCPDMFYISPGAVLFNEIYSAYEKNDAKWLAAGQFRHPFLCYEGSRYDRFFQNQSKVLFNGTTCYRNRLSLTSSAGTHFDEHYLRATKHLLDRYRETGNDSFLDCDRHDVYQCINSTKCILIFHLNDGVNDCPLHDDEDLSSFNRTAVIEEDHYPCGRCDMNTEVTVAEARKRFSFRTVCDGLTMLSPVLIDGRTETDETECELWECNNVYTRCNGLWNCLNGEDELDCDPSPLLKCAPDEHVCVSIHDDTLICLPVSRANDGVVDCLGALDERALCREKYYEERTQFHCVSQNTTRCLDQDHLCDTSTSCDNNDDERFCGTAYDDTSNGGYCGWVPWLLTKSQRVICDMMKAAYKRYVVHFSLGGITSEDEIAVDQNQRIGPAHFPTAGIMPLSQRSRCHRGLDLRVWLDDANERSIVVCLCPAGYYGERCQYQNQRVRLIAHFRTWPHSRQTPFAVVLSLIDDGNVRLIHSFEQLTYLSARYCDHRFFTYLTYSSRRMNQTNKYAVHIDIYERTSLAYRGSFLLPITSQFFPVHALSMFMDIPQHNLNDEPPCTTRLCGHGKCVTYLNDQRTKDFCQCDRGWSGHDCNIPYKCTCSSDALCLGMSADRRPICVCPTQKFGPRCLLIESAGSVNGQSACQNGGTRIPLDEYLPVGEKFTCICPRGFHGDRCQVSDREIILSFHGELAAFESIFVHFIAVVDNEKPVRTTVFRTISLLQDSVVIRWPQPFHVIFIEMAKNTYYFVAAQKTYNRSAPIRKAIDSSHRCRHISEVFSRTVLEYPVLRRIKHYRLPCQDPSLDLTCFYDDIHLCFCYDYLQKRLTNCLEFNHTMTFDCSGQNECEHGGQCFQDSTNCPERSTCFCQPCYYGKRCQFTTSGLSLSLDNILGYYILPHVTLIRQPSLVKISIVLAVILIAVGLINGTLSMITFKDESLLTVGCGVYLLGSSITTLLVVLMFGLKFGILILAQTSLISDRLFLRIQCVSLDFLLRICLGMDQWLNACVASERAITVIKGTRFIKSQSKRAAKLMIVLLVVFTIASSIHDPIHRRLIEEVDDDGDNKQRIWCIVKYSTGLLVYNSVMHTFQFFMPFVINLASAITLLVKQSERKSTLHNERSRWTLFGENYRQHRHLIIAPILLVILAIPRLIISFGTGCMRLDDNTWLFLMGYFISLVPPTLTFMIFVLPSRHYKSTFRKSVARYQNTIHRRI